MRFTVEERHLTDSSGRPVATPDAVSFHSCEAESLDDCVQSFIARDQAELMGDVLKFPGFQAMATVRKTSGVYTLQITPASQRNLPAL
jgi:hypothetical protein